LQHGPDHLRKPTTRMPALDLGGPGRTLPFDRSTKDARTRTAGSTGTQEARSPVLPTSRLCASGSKARPSSRARGSARGIVRDNQRVAADRAGWVRTTRSTAAPDKYKITAPHGSPVGPW